MKDKLEDYFPKPLTFYKINDDKNIFNFNNIKDWRNIKSFIDQNMASKIYKEILNKWKKESEKILWLEININIMKFENKIVLITGGSRGIGAEATKLFAKEGATVIINYCSDEDSAKKLLEEINNKGIIIKADVSKEEAIKSMFKQISENFSSTAFQKNFVYS